MTLEAQKGEKQTGSWRTLPGHSPETVLGCQTTQMSWVWGTPELPLLSHLL